MKTPCDLRREDIKEIFKRRLGKGVINLTPLSIVVSEDFSGNLSNVSFSFERESDDKKRLYQFKSIPSRGFVDAVYIASHKTFVEEFRSLRNLSLVDINVKPLFAKSLGSSKTDAPTDVIFRLEVSGYGMSEFSSRSSSIVRAGFTSMLEAFQFYINCDKTFKKLKDIFEDASSRNRADIVQETLSDLTSLTRVNTYV